MENKLPNGWTACPLKDVVSSRKGKKPNSVINHAKKGYDPYILIDELEGNPPRTYTNDPKIPRATEKDVLLVWDGSIGKCASGLSGAVGSTIAVLSPKNELNTKYLEYFIKRSKNYITETSTGSGLQHVNKSLLKTLKIPLPPDGGQERIADKLDVLLAKVKDAQSRLNKIPQILKRFRQSILAAACSGRLTLEWREKLKQDYPNDKTSSHDDELPLGWKRTVLGEVLETLTDYHANGSYKTLKEHVTILPEKSYAIYVRATNLESRSFAEEIKYVSQSAYEFLSKSKLYGGEIIIGKIGNAGKVYLMPNLGVSCTLGMNLFLLRTKQDAEIKFIYYHLKSPFSEEEIKQNVKGATNQSIDKKSIRSITINLPLLKEQQEIIRRVEQLFMLADQIETRYTKTQGYVDKLEQSILAKAFRGELVSRGSK